MHWVGNSLWDSGLQDQALRWWRKAARRGHAASHMVLGAWHEVHAERSRFEVKIMMCDKLRWSHCTPVLCSGHAAEGLWGGPADSAIALGHYKCVIDQHLPMYS